MELDNGCPRWAVSSYCESSACIGVGASGRWVYMTDTAGASLVGLAFGTQGWNEFINTVADDGFVVPRSVPK